MPDFFRRLANVCLIVSLILGAVLIALNWR